MKIAIGTERAPKVDGIKAGVAACPYLVDFADSMEYILKSVSSDIASMPLSIEETMKGAQNRAQNLIKEGIDADYYIGIEGGTTDVLGKKYLGGVVYIQNKSGEGHFGFSPHMEVPEFVEHKLYGEGLELGPIMAELSGKTDIRSENGSMGAWSADMLTRRDEFESAFKAAISPFYNPYFKL
ncbi:MAG: inosine/xanthosine triphosphatase [Candidatus Gracilibacteria bacterium]|nr:inosine/xanthosine triphosphatase [Candidatus Gracilibacteria bacterium]